MRAPADARRSASAEPMEPPAPVMRIGYLMSDETAARDAWGSGARLRKACHCRVSREGVTLVSITMRYSNGVGAGRLLRLA